MKYTFQSCFAGSINAYIEFRRSLGFTTETSLTYLRRFDLFCTTNGIVSGCLNREIVDAWFKSEQENGYPPV